MGLLKLENLHVALEDGTEIVKGVDLEVDTNQVHAIMGPNGSGKSTLAYAIMGHPAYEVTEGRILLDGVDVTELGADERAQRGLFLAFQYPHAIPGVTVTSFLRSAINAVRKARNGGADDPIAIPEFRKELLAQMDRLKVSRELASRYLNDGFSGGEKKRVEILQMAMLKPRIAVLDETDSGLDIDALRVVADGVKELVGPEMGALVITHYQRILDYIKPDFVHVFVGGRIVEEGGPELAEKLEAEGYAAVRGGGRRDGGDPDRDRGRPGDRLRLRDQVRLPRRRRTTSSSPGRGLSHELVDAISSHKNEPDWMRKFRHKSLDYFLARPLPTWGGNVAEIDFENIYYYIKPTEKQANSWEDLPADIKDTWDKLGIPEAEKKYLAGVGAQYESEVVYHKLQEDLAKQGVIFLDTDTALREHEELFRQYFGTIIPQNDNKFAALNSAVWSGGSFIYVPPGVKIEMPLQAYFRINAENMGQFERTLIIVDEGAYVHYVEGCTAPIYSSDSLHSAVVEIVVKKGAPLPLHDDPELVEQRLQPRHQARRRLRGRDDGVGRRQPRLEADDEVPGDLADGRARARRGALDRVRRQGPAPGRGRQVRPRRAEHDVGDHVEVDLEERRPRRLSRPARGGEGRARGAKSKVVCDALILDEESRSDTYPYMEIDEDEVDIGHEATVSKIGEEQLFYLMSRGLSEAEATAMIVSGFVEPITKELPLEYAVEMNRLIQLQMEGSVG